MSYSAAISIPHTSRLPLHVFVDVKFTSVGLPFAYGLVVFQDDLCVWQYGAHEAGFFDPSIMGDRVWSHELRRLDKISRLNQDLRRHLRRQLHELERMDFNFSILRNVNHCDSPRLTVYANRVTLVYLHMLLGDEVSSNYCFHAVNAEAKTLKRIASEQGLTGFPHNPLTWAYTAAMAI